MLNGSRASSSSIAILLFLAIVTSATARGAVEHTGTAHRVLCPPAGFQNKLVIHQLYVGQGDSALIRTPSGQTILIDGGDAGSSQDVIIPTLKSCYPETKKLDYIVLTHPHSDHFAGLIPILESGDYPIGAIILPGDKLEANESGPVFRRFLADIDALKSKGTRKLLPSALGDKEIKDPQVNFDIVAVDGRVLGKGQIESVHDSRGFNTDDNSVSIAMTISFGKFKFFTAGDLTGGRTAAGAGHPDVESAVAQVVGPVDVYKASHHGSDTSNKPAILNALKPAHILVSVGSGGKNLQSFHLPRREAMQAMNDLPSVKSVYMMSKGQSSDILPVGRFKGMDKVTDLGGEAGTDLIVTTSASGGSYSITAEDFKSPVFQASQK